MRVEAISSQTCSLNIEWDWKYLKVSFFQFKNKRSSHFHSHNARTFKILWFGIVFCKKKNRFIFVAKKWKTRISEKSIETRSTHKHVNNNPTPMKNIREEAKFHVSSDSIQWLTHNETTRGFSTRKLRKRKFASKMNGNKNRKEETTSRAREKERPWQILTYNIYFLCFSLFSPSSFFLLLMQR